MAIYLSEKLKQFRKSRDLTQEQIADIFHVSPQAVSRWETGVSFPDIEMLPSVAEFFKVTVDDLLGVDIRKEEERVIAIFEQTNKLMGTQKKDGSEIDKTIDILNNALKEFPNNIYLLARLSGAFRRKAIACKEDGKEDEMKKYAEKSLKLSERIMSKYSDYSEMPAIEQKYGDGKGNSMHYGAIGNIAYLYNDIGETGKAAEWANKLPDSYYTKTTVLSRILKGEEKINQLKQNISEFSGALNAELKMFANILAQPEEYDDFMKVYERFKTVVAELEKYAKKET